MRRVTEGPAIWPEDPVEIVRATYPLLLAAARRIAPTRHDAEDLVQEALVETLSRHPEFAGIAHPLGYLRTVLYRTAFKRRRVRWVEVPLHLQEHLEAASAVEDRVLAEATLSSLGPKQRACLVLRYLHGLDDAAIASILGCSRSTVRSQVTRALAAVRKEMGGEQDV